MRDVLVTGTDTGVGKTVIAAALVKALRARGVRAVGFKPVETGVDAGEPSDSELLQRATGEAIALAAPLLSLPEPLAPAVAAERAGKALGSDAFEERLALLRSAGYVVVVEGAGGLMAPLCWTSQSVAGQTFYTALDLAARCGLSSVIVARAGLGTLNHIFLTAAMLQAYGIEILAVVLNAHDAANDLAEATNPDALARMLPDIPCVRIPRHAGDAIEAAVPAITKLANQF